MAESTPDDIGAVVSTKTGAIRRDLRKTMLSGVALTVPFFITLLVLAWALDMFSNAVTPFVDVLVAFGPWEEPAPLLAEGLAIALLVGVVFFVGLATRHGPDTHLAREIEAVMEDIPGIGTVYTSVEEISDVLLGSDAESFESVKLVEFPQDGSYALGFLTAEAPSAVEESVDQNEMLTVFVPLAPNPVMGGHLLNLPPSRVHDVDLSIEEAMKAIMTTGIAIDESTAGA